LHARHNEASNKFAFIPCVSRCQYKRHFAFFAPDRSLVRHCPPIFRRRGVGTDMNIIEAQGDFVAGEDEVDLRTVLWSSYRTLSMEGCAVRWGKVSYGVWGGMFGRSTSIVTTVLSIALLCLERWIL
jgi:hypothetical protein